MVVASIQGEVFGVQPTAFCNSARSCCAVNVFQAVADGRVLHC